MSTSVVMELSPSHIERLKREAKRWQKDSQQRASESLGEVGMTYCQALDLVAQREGFPTWAALMKAQAN